MNRFRDFEPSVELKDFGRFCALMGISALTACTASVEERQTVDASEACNNYSSEVVEVEVTEDMEGLLDIALDIEGVTMRHCANEAIDHLVKLNEQNGTRVEIGQTVKRPIELYDN